MAPPRGVSSPPRRTDAAQIDRRRQKFPWLPSSAVRQLTFQGPGELVWEDVPAPQLEGDADAMLVPLPDGVDAAAVASVSDNVPDGWRAVAPQLQERPGAPVLIVGGGGDVALYAAAVAVAAGSAQVDYVDTDERRLRVAAS